MKTEFKDQLPDITIYAYYRTPSDIRNHMYKARLGLQLSKLDLVNLQELVVIWRSEKQDESFSLDYVVFSMIQMVVNQYCGFIR